MSIESPADSLTSLLPNQLKVAVLAGGIGTERQVSLQSGECVTQALKGAGVNVICADIAPDHLSILDDKSVDVFFIALHGEFGEDGQLQQILEDKSLFYTGSGPAASRLAFDKLAAKKAFTQAGIDTPKVVEFNKNVDTRQLEQLLQFADKYVVKPVRQGSSFGVSIANDVAEAIAAAQKNASTLGDCVIEEFIPGREITVGILCGKALPIIEIRPKENFYNYMAKYIDEQTEFLFGTIDDASIRAKIEKIALQCFYVLGCQHFGRVDFILGDDGKIYALEVNSIPGLTAHSLLPKAAAKAGISVGELCLEIIEEAWKGKMSTSSVNSND